MLPAAAIAQRLDPSVTRAPAQNALYVEALGNALFGSVNYERMVAARLWARVGVGPSGALPIMLNYVAGSGAARVEAGAGVLATKDDAAGTATLGVRYQPAGGGVLLRAGVTPYVERRAALWGGVSVGIAY